MKTVFLLLCISAVVAVEAYGNPDECVAAECEAVVEDCKKDGECSGNYDGFALCIRGWGCGLDCQKCLAKGTKMDSVVSCAVEKNCVKPFVESFETETSSALPTGAKNEFSAASLLYESFRGTVCQYTGKMCNDYRFAMVRSIHQKACQMIPKALTCRYPKANFNYFDQPWEDGTCEEAGFPNQNGSSRGCDKAGLPADMSHTWWYQK